MSGISVGIMLCGGNILVTSVVISIPGACSNYFCMFTFRMFVSEFYCQMHIIIQSKRWTLCKQQQQARIVKRKETCIYLKGGVWPSSLYKRKVKSYAETISLSSNYASTHIFQLSHLLVVGRK